MLKRMILSTGFLWLILTTGFSQEKYNYVEIGVDDTREKIIRKAANVVPTERQLRWQQLELTAFFHFGINTFTGREWGDGTEEPKLFNPENLDAGQWIKTIKDAGFKQVVLTAKHHDGFCLWPTATTQHSVKSSSWKNGNGDVVKAVAEACREHEIGFGIYLSPWDRNAKSYGTEAYNDFFAAQLTELLTRYGQVDEVWFDGACGEGPNGKKQVYDFMRWYRLIRELQPQAVIAVMGPDVRWVGTETGVGRFTEWSVIPSDHLDLAETAGRSQQDVVFKPAKDLMDEDLGSREKIYSAKGLAWYPAETDVSIRPGWFYRESEDNLVKTPGQLLDIYFTSVGMNGVLLLNIPPDKNGLINQHDVQSLTGFKSLLDNLFADNLAAGATTTSNNGMGERLMLDGDYQTYFTTASGTDTTTNISIVLSDEKTFNVLCLQENIAVGQRVEQFSLEYQNANGNWRTIATGTTIGYKRLLRFDNITAKHLRLSILSSRLNPAISEFGIYYSISE